LRLYYHYCPGGFSNSYILGTDFDDEEPEDAAASREASPPREALIVDPGIMDSGVLSLIEDNNYSIRGILITHDHSHHTRGLKTIMKIYKTGIYAVNPEIMGHRTMRVQDGDIINLEPFKIEVITIPGHSADSAVFKIDRLLFSGDVLSSGHAGNTSSSYAAATQINALKTKILSLPGDYIILPGHGPPSSLGSERRFNMDLNSFDQQKDRRPVINIDLD